MATDYLAALQEYKAGGGKDINEFLKMHTVSPVASPGSVLPAATPQPSSVAARLAAADAAERLGIGAQPAGNVITNRALRPITAESDALQAKIDARNSGVVVSAAAAQPAVTAFAPTPRRIVPSFDPASALATSAQQSPSADAGPAPWWKFKGDSAPSTNPGGVSGETIFDRERNKEGAVQNFLFQNTRDWRKLPTTVNYNASSSL